LGLVRLIIKKKVLAMHNFDFSADVKCDLFYDG
jgi:hypothetical protein